MEATAKMPSATRMAKMDTTMTAMDQDTLPLFLVDTKAKAPAAMKNTPPQMPAARKLVGSVVQRATICMLMARTPRNIWAMPSPPMTRNG